VTPTFFMKPAVAYIRYSSDRQAEGDSTRRQLDAAKAYCASKGFALEKVVTDEGQSAFKGHHLSNGNLGKFLTEADKGAFRGYAFVIEEIDRLSRQGVLATFELIARLLNDGLEVHEINTSKIIRELDDLDTADVGVLTALRGILAKEHSRKLKVRLLGARAAEREQARVDGLAFTSRCPSWCFSKPGQKAVLIEERAATVRRIFELAAQGLGAKRIVNTLKAEGRQMFRRGEQGKDWSPEFVTHLLSNRSVLGQYQPHKLEEVNGKTVRVPDGDPIAGFFPAVISQALWNAARASVDAKNHNPKKVGGSRGGGRQTVNSIFGPTIFDATQNHIMRFWQKKHEPAYLITRWQSGQKANYLRYDRFETAFRAFLAAQDWKAISRYAESAELKAAQADLDQVLTDLDKTSRAILTANSAIDNLDQNVELDEADKVATLSVLASRVAKHEITLRALTEQRNALQARVDAERSKCEALQCPEELLSLIEARDPETLLKLKDQIARRVSRIDIDFEPNLEGVLAIATVTFVNGYPGQILIVK
jgi:DNA invertase Pin-like site-specific DNA recombinase